MEYIIHNSRKRRAEILRGKRGFNVVNPKMMVQFKLEEEVEELDFQHGAHSEEQISMLRKATNTLSDFCKVTPVKQMKTALPALV
ncbi:uncharacterized protein LOC122086639 isoform X2 [Macadamia integrifolia]|uniref:uncharacterized protein LOC122086639 isoform X2 n=1 Tax=Macadamia integrifolia TaxID=60698 RepID=UPI001C4F5EBB|nr:uncharacterized protein LOC122086639 isoform X2 [Macadamia integrifolia]